MPVTSIQTGLQITATLGWNRCRVDQLLDESPTEHIAADCRCRFRRQGDVAENHANSGEVHVIELLRIAKGRSRRVQAEMKHWVEPSQQIMLDIQPGRVKLEALDEAAPCRVNAIRLRWPRRISLIR